MKIWLLCKNSVKISLSQPVQTELNRDFPNLLSKNIGEKFTKNHCKLQNENLGFIRFKHGLFFCEGTSPQSCPWSPNCLKNVR